MSSRLSAISAIEIVLDSHMCAGSRHQLRHVSRDLPDNGLEEVARANSLGNRRDGVPVVEALDFVRLLGEAGEVLSQRLISPLSNGEEVGLRFLLCHKRGKASEESLSQGPEGRDASRTQTSELLKARPCEGQAEGLAEGGVRLPLHRHPRLIVLDVEVGVRTSIVGGNGR